MDRWSFAAVAGPDTGRIVALPSGRHRFGREPTGLVIDDPALEVHHLMIDVGDVVRCAQLSGRIPVRVDGQAIAGFVVVVDGAFVEVGGSLLRLERRGRLGADQRDAVRRRWPVTLGIGDVEVEPAGRPNGGPGLGALPFDEQVVADAGRRRAGVPVVIDLAKTPRLGVTGQHRVAVAMTILDVVRARARIAPVVRWSGVSDQPLHSDSDLDVGGGVIMVCDAERFRKATRALADVELAAATPSAMIVLAEHVDDLPADCTARLSVGARWRGTFVADTATGFDAVVPLHVAGRSAQRSRSFITQQIARTGAELGGDIAGVPEAARGERQTSASDARIELVAHSSEQLDLLVEPWAPRCRQSVPILRCRRPIVRE